MRNSQFHFMHMKHKTRTTVYPGLRITHYALRILLACFIVTPTIACGVRAENAIIVAGSTSVQPYAEILAEEFEHLTPGMVIEIQGGGSSAGITAAQSGTADIGMSSRHLKESEEALGLWEVEIAKDGLAVVVHPSNPVSDLLMEEIRDIYTQSITHWSDLGGRDAKIHVIAREEGSGTRSAFEELVMDGQRITPRAIVQNSNGAVRQLVADDPNAIGFISLGLADHTVKALWLDGTAATRENVINGSYRLYRPFLFVTQTEPEPEGLIARFIDYILSPAGQELLSREGLIPE